MPSIKDKWRKFWQSLAGAVAIVGSIACLTAAPEPVQVKSAQVTGPAINDTAAPATIEKTVHTLTALELGTNNKINGQLTGIGVAILDTTDPAAVTNVTAIDNACLTNSGAVIKDRHGTVALGSNNLGTQGLTTVAPIPINQRAPNAAAANLVAAARMNTGQASNTS